MKFTLLLIISLIAGNSYSQDAEKDYNYNNTPIGVVLADVEHDFDVKFSYNVASIKDIYVSLQLKKIGLASVMKILQERYFISFHQINNRYYVIKRETCSKIRAYVYDALNNRPLFGATVELKTFRKGTVTNESGYFELSEIYKSDSLFISYLAYKPVVLSIHEIATDSCLIISMSPKINLLSEVVIKEYLGGGFEIKKDGSVEINPQRQDLLAGLLEPDVLANAQLLPGIVSPSETATDLYIRGGSPDQNLVLWDGIKTYKTDHFFGEFTAFNSSIIKSVQVYRSGTSPKYGDRVSGVLDISTDNEVPQKLQGGFGSNLIFTDAYLKVPISPKVGVIMSCRRSLNDWIPTQAFNQYFKKAFQNTSIEKNEEQYHVSLIEEDGQFFFYDYTLKTILDVSDKDKITFSSLYTFNHLDYNFNVIDSYIKQVDKLNISNLGMGLDWGRTWNPKLFSKVSLYYTDYNLNYAGKRPYTIDESRNLIKRNKVNEVGFVFDNQLKLNKQYHLNFGYQLAATDISFSLRDINFYEDKVLENSVHSVYANLNYNKTDKWNINIGFRSSYFKSLQKVRFEPRLYAEYLVNNFFRLKGSAELKSQSISQIVEFTTQDFGVDNQIWTASLDDKNPIVVSDQFSLGFLYSKNDFLVDVDFYRKITDGLTSFTKGFELFQTNYTAGLSATKGMDVLLKKKISHYTSWLGYTYSKTNFFFDNLNSAQEFRGNNDITHSITWSHFYKWKNFQFSMGWKYRTGIPYTPEMGVTEENGIEYGTINSETLPHYHRLDFSTLYNFKLSSKKSGIKGKVGFSLLNVYNKKNILNRKYRLYSDNSKLHAQKVNRLSLGFTPNVLFRIDF